MRQNLENVFGVWKDKVFTKGFLIEWSDSFSQYSSSVFIFPHTHTHTHMHTHTRVHNHASQPQSLSLCRATVSLWIKFFV